MGQRRRDEWLVTLKMSGKKLVNFPFRREDGVMTEVYIVVQPQHDMENFGAVTNGCEASSEEEARKILCGDLVMPGSHLFKLVS